MKAHVYDMQGKKVRSVDAPVQFSERVRADVIRRAFLALQSHKRQPYAAYAKAGQRSSATLSRRRRDFKTAYGHGISRVPRKSLWRRGTQFGWVGAFAPGTVGGRRAHPPKIGKIWAQKVNKKERRMAIRSALAATLMPDVVRQRGHRFAELPSVIETGVESLQKTKDVRALLEKLSLVEELARVGERKIRAGKGTTRGRVYKLRVGPLFVTASRDAPLVKAAGNLAGVDVCAVHDLNVGVLAPGGQPGRLTLYSEAAMELLKNERLFTNHPVAREEKKESQPSVQKPAQKQAKPVAPRAKTPAKHDAQPAKKPGVKKK